VLLVTEDDRGLILVLAGRLLWRYRSELAPLAVALGLAVCGLWAHSAHPGWAVAIAAMATVGAAVILWPRVATLARWWSVLGRRAERIYAASVVLLGGLWLAAATRWGPGAGALPMVALVGTVAGGVPWWAHRRRRARVRVERTIDAWPQFAESVGLAGSRVASAVVDRWGWTGRLALRRGQTARHVVDAVPAIESALGVRPGAVQVEPDRGRADRALLRVVSTDPLAGPIPWSERDAARSAPSVAEPVELGLFDDGSPVLVRLLYRNVLVGGVVGSGKSGVLNVLLAALAACRDVAVWGIDLKGGMELQPWAACLGRLATTPADAAELLAAAVAELDGRAADLTGRGERLWKPAPDRPALVIVVDEYAELPEDAHRLADSIARRGRAVAVTLLVATQRPTQAAMGHGAVRSQMDVRVCLRVRERRDTDLVLGQGMYADGWRPGGLDAPGKLLISSPEHTTPRPARAYLITDDDVRRTAAVEAGRQPAIDAPSATGPSRQPEEETPPGRHSADAEEALWTTLRAAPDQGATIPELMAATRMSRPWVYLRLRELADAGRVAQVSRGRWRALDWHSP
jgi:S-DNA-T family DNA segregation ATPase FtsK/SpoIIIE